MAERNSCSQLQKLLKIEIKALKKEIELNKYYLGEKLHRPVSNEEAEKDYLAHHLNGWASGFKSCYCNLVCEEESCKYRRELYG